MDTKQTEEQKQLMNQLMALVRVGWNMATTHLTEELRKFDVMIDALNSENKRKFVFEFFNKEMEEIKEEQQPSCTKDPNTCKVAFCNWNKCLTE